MVLLFHFHDFNDFTVAFAIILALIVCRVSSLSSPRGASVRHTYTISFECRKTQGNSNSSQSELWHSVVFKIDAAELVCSVRGIIFIAAKHMAVNVNVDFNYKLFLILISFIYVGHQQVYYLFSFNLK